MMIKSQKANSLINHKKYVQLEILHKNRLLTTFLLPMVHPSPRNHGWHKKNPWFEAELVPILQSRVEKLL